MGSDNKPKEANVDTFPPAKEGSIIFPIAIVFISSIIGFVIGSLTYRMGDTDTFDANIKRSGATMWLCLSLVVLGRTVAYVNAFPMKFKGSFKGSLRSNPFIYRTNDGNGPPIIFEDSGIIGKYNRSNRSLQHMVENIGPFLASLYFVGSIFPFPTFVLTCIFCVGRILHQVGYTEGYGKHATGFTLVMLSTVTVEGLLLVVATKTYEL